VRWGIGRVGMAGSAEYVEAEDMPSLARVVAMHAVDPSTVTITLTNREATVDPEMVEGGDVTFMSLSTSALLALRQAWQAGSDGHDGGRSDRAIVAAVRDLFDGRDGDLHRIAMLEEQ
jgi:hypothetical protein